MRFQGLSGYQIRVIRTPCGRDGEKHPTRETIREGKEGYTFHEREVEAKHLQGRDHKMIIGPENFGKAKTMCFGNKHF
jgi:hypothetical protein